MNTHKAIQETVMNEDPLLLDAQFNQDDGCFAVSTESGFKVYNTDPLELRVDRSFNKSIGSVTMLHRTNYLGLVSGGKDPFFSVNKLVIWDDLKKKKSLELEFNTNVLKTMLSRTRIVVVLRNQVMVYGFNSPPKLISSYDTIDNLEGIADMSSGSTGGSESNSQILAFPGRSIGQIQIVDISNNGHERNLVSIIKLHKSKIKILLINKAANMIASASETGTIIRIHSISTCSLLYEFRRGLDKLIVTSMRFSPNGTKLAVLSDKNTLHVYSISNQVNNKSHLFNMSVMPQYFKSQWSFLSCHLENNHTGKANDTGVVGWSDEDGVIIIWKFWARWEKYILVEKDKMGEYELIRESWRKLM